MSSRFYNIIIIGIPITVLGIIGIVNTFISLSPIFYGPPAVRAEEWQRRHHGGVDLTLAEEGTFKLLRMADSAETLRTVVLGSSHSMAITSDLVGQHSYNLAVDGNDLATQIAQGRYVASIAPRLRTVYFSLDWARGDVFASTPIPTLTAAQSTAVTLADVGAAAKDSLALPRVVGLVRPLLRDLLALRRPQLLETLSGAVAITKCPDGSSFANFGIANNLLCAGFLDDGSTTFGSQERLDSADVQSTIQRALIGSSRPLTSLALTGGRPSSTYLDAVAEVNRTMVSRGGRAIALIPAVFPGVKQAILRLPGAGDELRVFDNDIAEWASRSGITVIDASSSEDSGCDADEFIDEFHATTPCYIKIFARFRDKVE
jgi:hypothetical protein